MSKWPSFAVWIFFLCSLVAASIAFVACGRSDAAPPTSARAWEYRALAIDAPSHERTGANALAANQIALDEPTLNRLGAEGWSLATSYLETETAYPNLGNPKYITGLQPNVRPMRLVLVFMRPKK